MTVTRREVADEPPRLGALESQVMDLLWDEGASTIRSLIDKLPGDFAYTTIATVLTNLHRKTLVESHKHGRSTLYQARGTREEHVASVMDHALGTSRDRAVSILHFAQRIPDNDLDLLRDYLRRRDEGLRP
ncbi:BlaI/MecI/CopY family transcriptional regulator [Dietzia maris]|uniref:BlaI/MecI/CopY family transcriptional regulator n=1 Tax=Dietzia maris TaxID=37915 RepID=A0AAE4R132_9ACTN|nr:BlaI/MecI/CopY family transcriptional regulator [Dietzia maris]MDV6300858.1 BlaI/MecI/CopY family transcriptional regulator [Dietzia maris]